MVDVSQVGCQVEGSRLIQKQHDRVSAEDALMMTSDLVCYYVGQDCSYCRWLVDSIGCEGCYLLSNCLVLLLIAAAASLVV